MCALNTRCRECNTLLGPEDAIGPITDPPECLTCRERAAKAAKLERERIAAENNPHALHARAIKVGKLLDEIDRQCGYAGLDCHADGFLVAKMAQLWTAQQWAEIAVLAGTNPPSDKTIGVVAERYLERARRAQQRAAS